jgi:lipopolysaccharide export system protein LptC
MSEARKSRAPKGADGGTKRKSGRPELALPRAGQIFSLSHRHSRTVSLLRLALPGAAVVLIGVVIAWSLWGQIEDGFRIGFSFIDPDEAKTLRMVQPRFAGMQDDSRPYLVTADEAIRASPTARIVRLINPKGDMTMKGGAWVALMAASGNYDQKGGTLDLDDGVELFHDKGMHFASKTAHIDLKAGTAEGHDPVTGNGPSIDITGEGFKVLEGGKRIIFTGKAKAVLYPRDNRPKKAAPRRQNRQ